MHLTPKKILTAIVILTFGGIGFTYAANNDCGLVATTNSITAQDGSYRKYLDIISEKTMNYEGIITTGALEKAFGNLKKYCCQNNKIDAKFCADFMNGTEYPESAYLYDQLIDVGFRRLDGRKDLAYGLEPDSIGLARRDFITNAAVSENITPETIMVSYKKYRTGINTLPGDKEKFIQNYNKLQFVSLKDKYTNLCTIMKEIYDKISEQKVVVGQYKNSFLAQCQKLANKRISDEYLYTKVLLSKKSNEMLHNSTQAYIQKYFIQDKMAILINTMNKVKSLFASMVQGAAASKSCSK